MARRRAATVDRANQHDLVIQEYRDRLTAPVALPTLEWEPVYIGPTWKVTDGHWFLPERTLGWDVLGFCGTWLQHSPGTPWRFTLEQARFVLWWYALNDDGSWVYRDAVLQRLKGWGKDPLGACLCATEMLGPCRFGGWDDDGNPIALDEPNAWVQTAAVAQEQTKNTMRLFPGLFTAEAKRAFRVQIGRIFVYAMGDARLIQALTSSPTTLEGGRPTFQLLNETQHWTSSNTGHDMADTIERNITKSPYGAARTLRITNAYEPSKDSVAQRDREAWEAVQAGRAADVRLLYDSIEAPPEAPLTVEAAPAVVRSIRGDSVWLSEKSVVESILDLRNPPSRSRRFWYNQIVAAEDAWVTPEDFGSCAKPDVRVQLGDRLAVFFDGSKSDDATALVGCRISDGHVITLGMWQPTKEKPLIDRAAVDSEVCSVFEQYDVAAFFADPSHTRDDETQERFWDALLDDWHLRWRDQLEVWAIPGKRGHSVLWDMASPTRTEQFTAAAERCANDIEDLALTHDGDPRLRIHVRNARRYPNRYGVSLAKEHRESKRKVDLAVAMVGARMARRLVMNAPPGKKKRSGGVW